MVWQLSAIFLLLLFYAVYIGKMLAQHRQGIKTDQMMQKKSGKLFYIEMILKISTYTVLLVEILSILLNTTSFPTAVRILGLAFTALGVVVFTLAVWTMRDSWRAGIALNDQTKMVTSGIYRISRNPAFLGFDLVYIGILLMFFNWFLCAITALTIVALHVQILQEEKYLASVFGEDYAVYKRKVRRYLG